jgi:hypothetical protein
VVVTNGGFKNMRYLMIENPGVAPIEGYTLFGGTTKREATDRRIIGTFGSGNKHGIAVALRQNVPPVIFCGTQKMSFFTQPKTIKGVGSSVEVQQICVKYGGKCNITGKTTTSEKELDQALEYGAKDWQELSLALREFVSNAIDACYEQELSHSDVVVEIVDENQVRAKSGYTRVFIPATMEVQEFKKDLGKWFLHFSEPELLTESVFLKKSRNRKESSNAVIYRRGVLIREFGNEEHSSLFDYNIEDLQLNESRQSSDWDCRYHASKALINANREIATVFLKSLIDRSEKWESSFDGSYLVCSWENKEVVERRSKTWQDAIESLLGDKGCFTSTTLMQTVSGKGYTPVIVNEGYHKFFNNLKLRTDNQVLTDHDLNQRSILPATKAVVYCLDDIWNKIDLVDLTHGEKKPNVHCFRQQTQAAATTLGFWKGDDIFINVDIAESFNDQLRDTIVEELCHHITKATDGSRDFANWLIRFAVEMSKAI